MRIKRAFASGALAVLFATAAHAQSGAIPPQTTVQHLYFKYCTARGREHAICAAYIGGIEDAMRHVGELVSAMPADTPAAISRALVPNAICPNDTVTRGAAVQAFRDWVHPNRTHWGEPAFFGVATALASTWPCPVSR